MGPYMCYAFIFCSYIIYIKKLIYKLAVSCIHFFIFAIKLYIKLTHWQPPFQNKQNQLKLYESKIKYWKLNLNVQI